MDAGIAPYIILVISIISNIVVGVVTNSSKKLATINDEKIKEINEEIRIIKRCIDEIKDDRAERNEVVNEKFAVLRETILQKTNEIGNMLAKITK